MEKREKASGWEEGMIEGGKRGRLRVGKRRKG